MKKYDLEEAFMERFLRYSELRQAGAYYSAVSRLAEIEHCLPSLNKARQSKWAGQLNNESLPEEIIQEVKAGIEEAAQKIRRIFSFGSQWNSYELLLVVQTRIEVELLLSFLRKRHYLTEHGFELGDVDEAILQVAKSKANKQDFRMAVNLTKRNWGLPINSKWLEEGLNAGDERQSDFTVVDIS